MAKDEISFWVSGAPGKLCKRCNLIKSITEYWRNKTMKDGLSFYCKKCQASAVSKWVRANPQRAHQIKRRWKKRNPEKVKEASRKRYKANPLVYKEKNKRWREKNPDKKRESTQNWEKANPEKRRAYARKVMAKKRSTPKGKLSSNISLAICRSLHNKKEGKHWENLTGYAIDKLIKHLERLFEPGMTWDNYGKDGWHVDHKIPISAFNFEKPEDEDFKRCWSLKNLQPMWARYNCSKQNKLNKPFQPSLIF